MSVWLYPKTKEKGVCKTCFSIFYYVTFIIGFANSVSMRVRLFAVVAPLANSNIFTLIPAQRSDGDVRGSPGDAANL